MAYDGEDKILEEVTGKAYEFGFTTDIDTDKAPAGLNDDIIRLISAKKNEPDWLLEWRLNAFKVWTDMVEPEWPHLQYEKPDFQAISYYAAPKQKKELASMDDVDPELRKTMDKLGISLEEQKRLSGVAVDFVMDSVSVATSFKDKLAELGIIFCSMSEAVQEHPELVRKHLGTVVPVRDNFYAALNSAVFTDGSFCYIPKGVKCPMELSTYFRINESGTGQFERTLVVADESSYVSYLEGCTAPQRDENQLHVQHRSKLVPRRRGRQGRGVQLRDQARHLPHAFQDQLDPGGDRQRCDVEVPQLHPQRGRQRGGILQRGGDQQFPASRHGHQNGAPRQAHTFHHHLEGHLCREVPEQLPRVGANHAQRGQGAEFQPVRQLADDRPMRGAHLPVHRNQEPHRPG